MVVGVDFDFCVTALCCLKKQSIVLYCVNLRARDYLCVTKKFMS